MSAQTGISWADSTFNPWKICTPVGPGCTNCYAAALARRFGWGEYAAGVPRQRTSAANWKQVERWNAQEFIQCANCSWRGELRAFSKTDPNGFEHTMCPVCYGVDWLRSRRRLFTLSLGDWLDNEAPIEWLVDLLDLIRRTPNLDWLQLSKRIGNWHSRLLKAGEWAARDGQHDIAEWIARWLCGTPPANVWIGATVVDQAEADRDIHKLLDMPARVRFLSIEPLLGDVDLSQWLHEQGNSRASADRNRGSVGRRERSDMASHGRIDANLANAGRHRAPSEGQLPEVAVHLGRDTLRNTSSPGGVVRSESISYTDRTGDQPQGWRPDQQPSCQLGGGDASRECPAQFPGAGSEGEGAARGQEHELQVGRAAGAENSCLARSDDAALDRNSVRSVAAHGFRDPDAENVDPRPLIAWVIVGGESGPHARPMHPDWVRSLRDQCAAASVPFLFKQWGAWAPSDNWPDDVAIPSGTLHYLDDTKDDCKAMWLVGAKAAGNQLNGRTHMEFPEPTHD